MTQPLRRRVQSGRVDRWFAIGLWLVPLVCVAWSQRAAAQNFTVTAPNMTDYQVNGQPDPRLTLVRGVTYTFSVNTPGHPFYIKTLAGSGTANQYSDGVTGNGATSGTLTFVVPQAAPNTLFYQCSVHVAMGAQIDVINAPPVPGFGAGMRSLLCLLLLMTAFVAQRRQRRARVAVAA